MPMAPPAALVRTARSLWRGQWRLLMGGLGPADAQGRYRRPSPAFGERPELPLDAATPGGHALIVGRSCPWAHRAWLTWSLRRLAGSIELVVVEPDPAAGRWRFPTPFAGCTTLAELYRRSGGDPTAPATVPALYSHSQQRILVNESARLIERLNDWPGDGPDLWPLERRPAIEAWRERLQSTVNDGVYRCGFARNQAAYDEAERELFESLDALEASLAAGAARGEPWLCGPEPSLADVVLFPTLIRLELVYAPLFGCSRLPLWQLPQLAQWRARFHQLPGVAATCFAEAWRRDYFGALFPLHPSGIVPAGPSLESLVSGNAALAAAGPAWEHSAAHPVASPRQHDPSAASERAAAMAETLTATESEIAAETESEIMAAPAPQRFEGVFGPYTITADDEREVLGYRLALTAAAVGLLGLLLQWHLAGPGRLWPWMVVMAAGLGLALRWIHIYLRPLHRALQLFWLLGCLGTLLLAQRAGLAEIGPALQQQPLWILAVGPFFAALTGVGFKEFFCFRRPEAIGVTLLLPVALLGRLVGLLAPGTTAALLTMAAALLLVLCLRKFPMAAAADVGDKSVFLHLEAQRRALAGPAGGGEGTWA